MKYLKKSSKRKVFKVIKRVCIYNIKKYTVCSMYPEIVTLQSYRKKNWRIEFWNITEKIKVVVHANVTKYRYYKKRHSWKRFMQPWWINKDSKKTKNSCQECIRPVRAPVHQIKTEHFAIVINHAWRGLYAETIYFFTMRYTDFALVLHSNINLMKGIINIFKLIH